jgi:tyrosinase
MTDNLPQQILQANAIDVANEWPAGPDRDRYVAAAQNLRLPYLDWAKPPASGDTIPTVLTANTTAVITPNGSQTIHNPLYSYQFHPTDAGLYYQIYVEWQQTMRWPSTQDASAVTQNDQLIAAMNSNQQQYQQRLYNLLTQYDNFMDFTNEPFIKSAGPLQSDSLESLHDSVHSTVGGNNYGHMDVIDVSAFDPIFWLHHAYVLAVPHEGRSQIGRVR